MVRVMMRACVCVKAHAERPNPQENPRIDERIEYISRAVINATSSLAEEDEGEHTGSNDNRAGRGGGGGGRGGGGGDIAANMLFNAAEAVHEWKAQQEVRCERRKEGCINLY